MGEATHRAGVVALLSRPNAGKSTLLNRLLGSKLAIVTPKPQTTRSHILGIYTREHLQIAFVDTPGRHDAARPLNVALNDIVDVAARGCDAALLLVDLTRGWGETETELADGLARRHTPMIAVGTKLDMPSATKCDGFAEAPEILRISALTGEGVPELLQRVEVLLPESPPLYPLDELSDRPLRFLGAECVREAAFRILQQELPYAVAVEVEEWDGKRPDLVRVRANLLVERESQKQIVIGKGGRVIKAIGIRARGAIETLVERKVHLELWVKCEPKWSQNPKRMKSLGYD
jgi:GTP-binding protein Era